MVTALGRGWSGNLKLQVLFTAMHSLVMKYFTYYMLVRCFDKTCKCNKHFFFLKESLPGGFCHTGKIFNSLDTSWVSCNSVEFF